LKAVNPLVLEEYAEGIWKAAEEGTLLTEKMQTHRRGVVWYHSKYEGF